MWRMVTSTPTWPWPGLRCGAASWFAVDSTNCVIEGVENTRYSPRWVVCFSSTSHSWVCFMPTFSVSIGSVSRFSFLVY